MKGVRHWYQNGAEHCNMRVTIIEFNKMPKQRLNSWNQLPEGPDANSIATKIRSVCIFSGLR